MIRKLRNILFVQVALACLMPLTLSAQNLLSNPGFEKPATGVPPGTPVDYTDYCEGGSSAAAAWYVWVNACGTDISTELIPSTLPGGGKYMMHVVTTGTANGIYQNGFANETRTLTSIWVYLNSGCIGMGTGDGADTPDTDVMSCEAGAWIEFKAPNGGTPANEFLVYAVFTPGADFYVDKASVVAAP
jgi:hypothetical protein